jgi:hypothetical protein
MNSITGRKGGIFESRGSLSSPLHNTASELLPCSKGVKGKFMRTSMHGNSVSSSNFKLTTLIIGVRHVEIIFDEMVSD